MFNPFKNLQSELQNDLQAAIKHLGPSFTHEGTDVDENAKTVLHWTFFGTNGDGFYHVSVYSNTSHDGWVCNGATIVPASALDFSPTHSQGAATA